MLTEREEAVIRLRKEGKTQAEIASVLGISQPAVSSFERNARRKINNAEELLRYLRKAGLMMLLLFPIALLASNASASTQYINTAGSNQSMGSSNLLYLDNTNGRIGVGISNPANTLQIGSVGSSGYGGNQLVIGDGTHVMAFYHYPTASTWFTNTNFSLMPSGTGSTGYVGIGTVTPNDKLEVTSGNIRLSNSYTLKTSTTDLIYGNGDQVNIGTSGKLVVNSTSGNVGIGVAAPTSTLEVHNSVASRYLLSIVKDSTGGSVMSISEPGSLYTDIGNGNYTFRTGSSNNNSFTVGLYGTGGAYYRGIYGQSIVGVGSGVPILALQPDGGNVGIGTTTPSYPLTFGTSVSAGALPSGGNWNVVMSDTVGGIGVGYQSTTNNVVLGSVATSKDIIFAGWNGAANTERMRITSTGNLNITGNLIVSGTGGTINGNTIWHAGNDGTGSGLDADTVDAQHYSTSWPTTLANIQSATTNDFHNIGGTDDDNPDSDAEVPDAITVNGGTIGSNNIAGTLTTTGTLTIGDGGDRIDVNSNSWDVTNGAVTGVTTLTTSSTAHIGKNHISVLDYANTATPTNGYLISTNIPYTSGTQMPYLEIEGFPYGAGVPMKLNIVWYVYNGAFTNYAYTNLGAWDPGTVELANNSGYVTIHFTTNTYYTRFTIRAYENMGSSNSWFEGWSVSDAVSPADHKVTVARSALITSITGNSGTATALAANGANCAAGQYPLGVDANGAAEGCTADDDTPDSDAEVPDAITVSGGTLGSNTISSSAAWTVTDTLNIDSNTLYVDGTNNRVGIGTNSVNAALEVYKGGDVAGDPQGIRITRVATANYATTYPVLDFYSAGTPYFTGRISSTFINGGSWSNAGMQLWTPNSTGSMTARMTISNDGNVGIGTTNPTERLHVMTGSAYTPSTAIFGGSGNVISQGVEPAYVVSSDINSSASQTGTETALGGMGLIYVSSSDYNNMRIGMQTNHKLIFRTNNQDRMTVSNDGNIGIGTLSPTTHLQIVGTGATQAYIVNSGTNANNYGIDAEATGAGTSNYAGYFAAASGTNNYAIYIPGNYPAAGANNYQIYANSGAKSYFNGNVGIGMTTPQAPLYVRGSTSTTIGQTPQIQVNNPTGATYLAEIGFGYREAGYTYSSSAIGERATSFAGYTKGELYFATRDVTTDTAPTQRMVITSAGNVGIGAPAPGASTKLQVAGLGLFTDGVINPGDGTPAGVEVGYNTGSDYGFVQSVYTGVAWKNLALQAGGGNLGVGTASPGSDKVVIATTGHTDRLTMQDGTATYHSTWSHWADADGAVDILGSNAYLSDAGGWAWWNNAKPGWATYADARATQDVWSLYHAPSGGATPSMTAQLTVAGSSGNTIAFKQLSARGSDIYMASGKPKSLNNGALGGLWTELGDPSSQMTEDPTGDVSIAGTRSSWDTMLTTSNTWTRRDGLTYEMYVDTTDWAGGNDHMMIGWHDNGAGVSYADLVYAFYFNNGNLGVYEDGNSRGASGSYTIGDNIWVRIVLKATGATYYYKAQGQNYWTRLYDSNYSSEDNLRPGISTYAGTYNIQYNQVYDQENIIAGAAGGTSYFHGDIAVNGGDISDGTTNRITFSSGNIIATVG